MKRICWQLEHLCIGIEAGSGISQNGYLVYCFNIPELMQKFGVEYKVNKWRLFVDSSKRRLKSVFLNDGNSCASLFIGHSVHLKESYEDLIWSLQR
jgi:hypothetical protein